MSFLLGCNYWASNAGTEMWVNFEPDTIDKDLKILSEHGTSDIRVFPLWRDFQPVTPLIGARGNIAGYTQGGKEPENEYYLDEKMLERFSIFLDICDKYKIKVTVGLITGWMSGALFIPTALYGKNVITDPEARYFEQLFIKGFVNHFKDRSAIYAWDLGNECNEMAPVATRFEAASWTAMISNAIRAQDPTRPIVSGMHGLDMTNGWTICDQGEFCDILTTHPYPFWCEHTRIDKTLSYRTLLLPTAQGKYYSDIGGRPCLAEEMGTMGPMICSDERSADFLRFNLFSLWANGSVGAMWWCSSDQGHLETFPYSEQMVERELGLMRKDSSAKPQLLEIKKFAELLKSLDFELPKYKSDAVCLLGREIRHWGIAYMTYLLARRAGMNISFAYADAEIPDSDLYLLPSVNEFKIMSKTRYEELKRRVYMGADLYISVNNAILSEFEELSGLRVIDSYEYKKSYTAELEDTKIEFTRLRNIITEPTSAELLSRDNEGYPFISVNRYGAGRVFFVNAPIEDNLIDTPDAFTTGAAELYKKLFAERINKIPVKISDSELLTSLHEGDDYAIVTVINPTEKAKSFKLSLDGYRSPTVYHGSADSVCAYDAVILKFKKEK